MPFTPTRLLLNSLRFRWRGHLLVVLGVVSATAVLAGALVVGDSVRESLRRMTLLRLGAVDFALTAPRFFGEALAADVQRAAEAQRARLTAAPAILMTVGLESQPQQGASPTSGAPAASGLLRGEDSSGNVAAAAPVRRAAGVQLVGCDDRLWELLDHGGVACPQEGQLVLNQRTAAQLGAVVGDEASLLLEIPAAIPRDSLLGDRDQTVVELPLKVAAVTPDALGLSRFGLDPSQQTPLLVYARLGDVQRAMGVGEARKSRTQPEAKPARVNAILFSHSHPAASLQDSEQVSPASTALGSARPATPDLGERPFSGILPSGGMLPLGESPPEDMAEALTGLVHSRLSARDLGWRFVRSDERGCVSFESEQMLIDDASGAAALKIAQVMGARTSPVLVTLLNEVETVSGDRRAMYAIAAGLEFPVQPPFGPWPAGLLPGPSTAEASSAVDSTRESPATNPSGVTGGAPDSRGDPIDVVLNDWLAEDLGAKAGDLLTARHHVVGDRGELPEIELPLRVAAVIPLAGPAADRGLTPYVPGITDADSFRNWRQPFAMKLDQITDRDDEYWSLHRATPKVFLRLDDAQRLWRTRYGALTSLRVAPPQGDALSEFASRFEAALVQSLTPGTTQLVVQPVKAIGLRAAQGTTDFAGLFLGFSMFLIAAAVLFVALLYRLGVDQRLDELGLLSAVGWPSRRVLRLILGEGLLLALIGVLLGLPAAVGYASVMVYGLKTWWNAAVGTQFLNVHWRPGSLIAGGMLALATAGLAIWLSVRAAVRSPVRVLLSGAAESGDRPGRRERRGRGLGAIVLLGAAGAIIVASLAGVIPAREAFMGLSWTAVSFFVSGVLVLLAGLSLLSFLLSADGSRAPLWGPRPLRFGFRNAARNRRRTLGTAALIASAAFVVAAVASGKRNPAAEAPDRSSGNGGFLLVAESSTPVLFDLNTAKGRAQLGFDPLRDEPLLAGVQCVPIRVQPGQNASCLNLYQATAPTILGIPDENIERFAAEGRFRFIGASPAEGWRTLLEPTADGAIPVLGDMNTLLYSLHKGPGQTFEVQRGSPENDARGPADAPSAGAAASTGAELLISGMFDGSVFQGVLVMSASNFLTLFPERAGARYFLIDVPAAAEDAAARIPRETPRALGEPIAELLETRLRDYGFDIEFVADRLANFLAVQNTYLATFQTLGGLGLVLGVLAAAVVMLRNVHDRRAELALLQAVGVGRRPLAGLILAENLCLVGWGLAAGYAAALIAMAPQLWSTGGAVPWRGLVTTALGILAAGLLAGLLAVRGALRAPIVSTLRGE